MRKITAADAGTLYAMKVLKKATLKGEQRRGHFPFEYRHVTQN